ncbi:hypothetical protein P7K49_017970 [Saguinus oedipus]|uniref:Uncharacterized protein n=1 Tax=Saguinus oedipus TaxID=9490 RepID=A0ABQ9V415_SAGOE|nr:hypothetical protein P7K49_017970 [Saguinus oedipus]
MKTLYNILRRTYFTLTPRSTLELQISNREIATAQLLTPTEAPVPPFEFTSGNLVSM